MSLVTLGPLMNVSGRKGAIQRQPWHGLSGEGAAASGAMAGSIAGRSLLVLFPAGE